MQKITGRKRKLLLTGIACVLCSVVLMTGTFAWTSLSQTAVNEAVGEMKNPGGRLHDDFDGRNKDIYVENYTKITSGQPIVVRVRLYEYMETGINAGDKSNRDGVTILTKNENASITDTATWDLYKPVEGANTHYGYWSWRMGGKTVYLPTFNKQNESLESDRNGRYDVKDALGEPYGDYEAYAAGDKRIENALYDNNVSIEETHYAKETQDGTVISMLEWANLPEEKQLGNYWVYDADGWAYWAGALWQESATGLLLDEITPCKTIPDKWYYAIYVECQMTDLWEIGSEESQTGFYSEKAGKAPSDTAALLLEKIKNAALTDTQEIIETETPNLIAEGTDEATDKTIEQSPPESEEKDEKNNNEEENKDADEEKDKEEKPDEDETLKPSDKETPSDEDAEKPDDSVSETPTPANPTAPTPEEQPTTSEPEQTENANPAQDEEAADEPQNFQTI